MSKPYIFIKIEIRTIQHSNDLIQIFKDKRTNQRKENYNFEKNNDDLLKNQSRKRVDWLAERERQRVHAYRDALHKHIGYLVINTREDQLPLKVAVTWKIRTIHRQFHMEERV